MLHRIHLFGLGLLAGLPLVAVGSVNAQPILLDDFTGGGNFGNGTYLGFDNNVTPSSEGLIINASQFGGGFTQFAPGFVVDDTMNLQLTARREAGNTLEEFDVVFIDGDSGGTGEGYLFNFRTEDFATDEFTTVNFGPVSGFTGGPNDAFGLLFGDSTFNLDGDGGLIEYQIQIPFLLGGAGTLNLTVARVELVEAVASINGDYNDSGQVEQGDLDLVLQNWGVDTDTAGVPIGWTNDLPSGQIEQSELDGVLQNWGNTAAPDLSGGAVPEPLGAASLLALAWPALRRRR